MKLLRKFSNRFKALVFRGQHERELDEEMRFHLEMEVEKNLGRGMSKAEAERAAKISFDGVEQAKEECQDAWGVRFVLDVWRDVRFGLRQMWKRKALTAVMLATLVVCVAGNTAIFSLIHSMMIRPYTYPEMDRVVSVGMQWRTSAYGDAVLSISPRRYLDIVEKAQSYEALGFCDIGMSNKMDLRLGEGAVRVKFGAITPGIWGATQVNPVLGRLFSQADIDSGETDTAILSYQAWKSLYDGDPNVIGESITLNNKARTIVAVLPAHFYLGFNDTDIWVPKVFSEYDRSEKSRDNNSHIIFGRLKSGVTIVQAQDELEAIYDAYLDRFPERRENAEEDGENYGVVHSADYLENQAPSARMLFGSIQGAFVFVLLIGVLNISGLILVRNWHRLGELAMRTSLGAPRIRIVRQLVTETSLLFILGGFLSLPLAQALIGLLEKAVLHHWPIGLANRLNGGVIAIVFACLFLVGMISGVLPALSISKKKVLSIRNTSVTAPRDKRSHWLQSAFVGGQICLSVILLVTTGVLLKNAREIVNQDFVLTVTYVGGSYR
ncbi:ABC transporter permease [Puniceicoccaceae bacterium K14]|nr:ABC transporter permease [Puniceicoccaceae bacterium K14]